MRSSVNLGKSQIEILEIILTQVKKNPKIRSQKKLVMKIVWPVAAALTDYSFSVSHSSRLFLSQPLESSQSNRFLYYLSANMIYNVAYFVTDTFRDRSNRAGRFQFVL